MSDLVSVDWLVLAPVLAPAFGALLVLLLDALAPRTSGLHLPVGMVAIGAGIGALPFSVAGSDHVVRSLCLPGPLGACFYETATWGLALQLTALVCSMLVLLLLGPGTRHLTRSQHGGPAVTVALVLTATAGAAMVPAARDLPTWLIAIELATLPAVGLVALSRSRGAEGGALSLLMTSLTSFALLAVGVAFWVLATGDATFNAGTVATAWADPAHHRALLLSVLLLVAGLGFKLSAVPFHTWTPQAFVTSDEPVATLLATTSKVAALSGLIVVLRPVIALDPIPGRFSLISVLGAIAIASMTLGNLLALRTDDPVRLLAWSTVAQGGWVLLPLATLRDNGIGAAVAYLMAYAVATLAVFGVASAVHTKNEGAGDRRLSDYAGLARTQPLLAATCALGLLTLAGLPPGIIGVLAKVVALGPPVDGGHWWLVLPAVANVVLGIAVYVRWLIVMVRGEGRPERVRLDPGLLAALVISSGLLVVTSAVPGLILGLVHS